MMPRRMMMASSGRQPAPGGGGTLLLDEPGLGSAAAAYSLRKLRSAYSGDAIRVRRSSDSTEQDIGFDGNDLDTTFVGANDGYIITWYDQSGNGRDITETAADPFRIVTSGRVEVDASGNPKAVQADTTKGYSVTGFSLTQPITHLLVAGVRNTITSTHRILAIATYSHPSPGAISAYMRARFSLAIRLRGRAAFMPYWQTAHPGRYGPMDHPWGRGMRARWV